MSWNKNTIVNSFVDKKIEEFKELGATYMVVTLIEVAGHGLNDDQDTTYPIRALFYKTDLGDRVVLEQMNRDSDCDGDDIVTGLEVSVEDCPLAWSAVILNTEDDTVVSDPVDLTEHIKAWKKKSKSVTVKFADELPEAIAFLFDVEQEWYRGKITVNDLYEKVKELVEHGAKVVRMRNDLSREELLNMVTNLEREVAVYRSLWANGWTVDKTTLYDEGGVEGWEWFDHNGTLVATTIGSWESYPEIPDTVYEEFGIPVQE